MWKAIIKASGNAILFFAVIIAFFIASACNSRNCRREKVPSSVLKYRVLSNGDEHALNVLFDLYKDECLPYCFFMADSLNNGEACNLIYLLITEWYEDNNLKMPSEVFNVVYHYASKGVELHNWPSAINMSVIYDSGKYVPRDTIKAQKYLELFHDFFEEVSSGKEYEN